MLHLEERIDKIFVENHMPTKDIHLTSFSPIENHHENHSSYLPFSGKYSYLSPTPFPSYFPVTTIYILPSKAKRFPLKSLEIE